MSKPRYTVPKVSLVLRVRDLAPTISAKKVTFSARFIHQRAIAFAHAFPVSPRHTLVIPRRHVSDFFELSPADVAAVYGFRRPVTRAVLPDELPLAVAVVHRQLPHGIQNAGIIGWLLVTLPPVAADLDDKACLNPAEGGHPLAALIRVIAQADLQTIGQARQHVLASFRLQPPVGC